jgi:uncharacterized membrane protein YphA (DoxX/SURF4 family)
MDKLVKIGRVFLAVMFLFSGLSKVVSLPFFDSMVAELLIGVDYFDKPQAFYFIQIFTRILIAFELLIGAALLQDRLFKKAVLPIMQLILIVFTIHLFYDSITGKGFIEGNCGCFGDILPMNNLESIIKNIVAMLVGLFVWRKYDAEQSRLSTLSWPLTLGAVAIFTLWFSIKKPQPLELENQQSSFNVIDSMSAQVQNILDTTSTDVTAQTNPTPEVKTTDAKPDVAAQKAPGSPISPQQKTKNLLTSIRALSDGKKMNLDKGEVLVCLFSMTCSHCQEVYKDICKLNIYLLNYGRALEQKYFLSQGGTCKFPHLLTEDFTFFKRVLEGESYPRMIAFKDGKIEQEWNLDTYNRDVFMKFYSLKEDQKEDGGLKLVPKDNGSGGIEQKNPWD